MFLNVLVIAWLLLPCSLTAQYKAFDPIFWQYFDENNKIEKVASGFGFTEGPVWHPDGYLLFSDIPGNTIFKIEKEKSSIYKKPSKNSNGLTLHPLTKVLVICAQKSKNVVLESGKVLIDNYEGKKFNSPNDIVFRKDGSFYMSDPPYGHMQYNGNKSRELSYTGVYFVKNGVSTLIDSSLIRANGVCLSPDEKILYVAQSEFVYLWKKYVLDNDGMVISAEIFHQSEQINGNPDGIKVDVEGNVYATANHGVVMFDKNGKLLGEVRLPENSSNLTWGDADLGTLYITAGTSVYKIRTKAKGYLPYWN
jgi:gluconolactonase